MKQGRGKTMEGFFTSQLSFPLPLSREGWLILFFDNPDSFQYILFFP